MFNGAIVDLATKPYIQQKFLLQWICCKCLAGCYRHSYFWPPWRLLETTHHTATAHFGTLGWTNHWVKVPKCALAVWCLASKSLHGGPKWSSINEISFHISDSRTKPTGLDFSCLYKARISNSLFLVSPHNIFYIIYIFC